MKMKREMKRVSQQVKGKLMRVFDGEPLKTLAHPSHFIQRATSKLEGPEFVELMTTEMLEDATVSLDGLCDLLKQRHAQADMTPQALHQRLLSPQACAYLQEVLQLALAENLAPIRAQLPVALLAPFGRVLLEDSTQCRLHEHLAEPFKGAGGSGSASAVNIDLIYD